MVIIPINNEQPSICSDCGGECCKWSPGVYHPSQLLDGSNDPAKTLKELLASDNFILSRYEGIVRSQHGGLGVEVVAPSTLKTKGQRFNYDNFGTCVNLTDTGCSLEFSKRPLQCQKLIPQPGIGKNRSCHYPTEFDFKEELVEAWRPYNQILLELEWE